MSKNEKMCDCNQGRLPCTCKPAEQHQGEPVAWRVGSQIFQQEHLARMHSGGVNKPVEPLYAHADPGEVEQHIKRRMEMAEQKTELHRQIEALRAQLAEAHALLRHREEMLAKVAGGWPIHIFTKDNPLRIKTCGEVMAYSVDGGMMTTFDPEKMQLSASAEPSAPVEIDERAEFEKHYASKNEGYCPSAFDGEYDWHDAQPCWESWQARAAMEKKP